MITGGTLFTGFGLSDVGMTAAGVDVLWGVEYDGAIAEVARANGVPAMTADILAVDPRRLERVDVLHASPPCPSFSVAKAGGEETPLDRALAEKVAEFIEVIRPAVFTLENVWGYRKSASWRAIYRTLRTLGYGVGFARLNSADFGVPQTRERMIAWAVRGGASLPAPTPTHTETPQAAGLFGFEAARWIGWYEAVEDLLGDMPDSELAPWQIKRLPDELRTLLVSNSKTEWGEGMVGAERRAFSTTTQAGGRMRAVIVGENPNARGNRRERHQPMKTVAAQPAGGLPRAVLVGTNANDTSGAAVGVDAARPAQAVRTGVNHVHRAVLIDGDNAAKEGPVYRDGGRRSPTVSRSTQPRALLSSPSVRVVQMTPRALARFQSLPDTYALPESRTLACRGIGNGFPCLVAQRLYEHILARVEITAHRAA